MQQLEFIEVVRQLCGEEDYLTNSHLLKTIKKDEYQVFLNFLKLGYNLSSAMYATSQMALIKNSLVNFSYTECFRLLKQFQPIYDLMQEQKKAEEKPEIV